MQKSSPAPVSTSTLARAAAPSMMRASSAAMASVMPLPRSGWLIVTRSTAPCCSTRKSLMTVPCLVTLCPGVLLAGVRPGAPDALRAACIWLQQVGSLGEQAVEHLRGRQLSPEHAIVLLGHAEQGVDGVHHRTDRQIVLDVEAGRQIGAGGQRCEIERQPHRLF